MVGDRNGLEALGLMPVVPFRQEPRRGHQGKAGYTRGRGPRPQRSLGVTLQLLIQPAERMGLEQPDKDTGFLARLRIAKVFIEVADDPAGRLFQALRPVAKPAKHGSAFGHLLQGKPRQVVR
jgi:hypothetical protein